MNQREQGAITAPEEDTQFKVGDSSIYVIEVEHDADQHGGYGNGRTRVLGHDDEGHEVEVFFYPYDPEEDI
jgi:hypothetical protein